MKIAEARQLYNSQIRAYREQQVTLSKQKQELEQKMNTTVDGKNVFAKEAATLELTMKAVDEKQKEYQNYICAVVATSRSISGYGRSSNANQFKVPP